MSLNDIFRGSFLAEIATFEMSMRIIGISLLTSTILGLYIFFIYRVVTKKTFYSQTFNLSLVAITVIITSVILAIQSNIVLSLGMVGALSIVRFRTPVKDPMDLMFLFWAITVRNYMWGRITRNFIYNFFTVNSFNIWIEYSANC
jgi:hypothetical protein